MENNFLKILFCKKILALFCLLCFFALPCFASAQSLLFTSNKTTYGIGDNILISLILDTQGKSINVAQGTIKFPPDFFDISAIKTGDSIFTLWPDRPDASNPDNIFFTGGVPHGFNGNNGNVLSFILKSKKAGESTVSIDNVSLLLNDGFGTKVDGVSLSPLDISVANSPAESATFGDVINDSVAPLPFAPTVVQTPSVEENKYFVSFSTTDEDFGVAYYEVREEYLIFPFGGVWLSTDWQKTETPYVLKLQHWWSKIYIRAYDGAGNFREEIITKPLDKTGTTILNILTIAIAIVLLPAGMWIYFKIKNLKTKKYE